MSSSDRRSSSQTDTYKKDSGGPHVPYDDVVEEALAFDWVDSQRRRLDERPWQFYWPAQARQRLVAGQPRPHRARDHGGSFSA